MSRTVLLAASLGALLLADIGTAQIGGRAVPAPRPPAPRPMPPQAIPVTPPPVNHPAYAAQPLMNNDEAASSTPSGPTAKGTKGAGPAGPRKGGPAVKRAVADALEFRKKKIAGKELARRIDKVTKTLRWFETPKGARATSASTGRPIFWVNGLGELDRLC